MTNVLHLRNDFLPDVATLVVADSALADLRHRRRLVDIDTVHRNAGLGSQNIPCTPIDGSGAAGGNRSQHLVRLAPGDPNIVADVRNKYPAALERQMPVTAVEIQPFAEP